MTRLARTLAPVAVILRWSLSMWTCLTSATFIRPGAGRICWAIMLSSSTSERASFNGQSAALPMVSRRLMPECVR